MNFFMSTTFYFCLIRKPSQLVRTFSFTNFNFHTLIFGSICIWYCIKEEGVVGGVALESIKKIGCFFFLQISILDFYVNELVIQIKS